MKKLLFPPLLSTQTIKGEQMKSVITVDETADGLQML